MPGRDSAIRVGPFLPSASGSRAAISCCAGVLPYGSVQCVIDLDYVGYSLLPHRPVRSASLLVAYRQATVPTALVTVLLATSGVQIPFS